MAGKLFTGEEAYGTPVVAAAARSINFSMDSFSHEIFFYKEETFVTPLVAAATWPRLLLRVRVGRCASRSGGGRKHKIHGDSFSRRGNICDTPLIAAVTRPWPKRQKIAKFKYSACIRRPLKGAPSEFGNDV